MTSDEIRERTKQLPSEATLLSEGAAITGFETIIEYVDRRFLINPILPETPINRAKTKMLLRHLITEGPMGEFALHLIRNRSPYALGKKRSAIDLLLISWADDEPYTNIVRH